MGGIIMDCPQCERLRDEWDALNEICSEQSSEHRMLKEKYTKLEAKVEAMREMLKFKEWTWNEWLSSLWCEVCDQEIETDHAPDCEMAALIREG